MLKTLRFHIPTIIWLIVILVLCFMDLSKVDPRQHIFFPGFDKLVHLGFFFVLSILMLHGNIKSKKAYSFTFFTIFKLIFITGFIGAGIEFIQLGFFPKRSAELYDFLCDMLGVGMAVFSFIILHYQYFNAKKS